MKYFALNSFKKTLLAAVAAVTISALVIPETQAQLPNLLNTGKRSKRTVNTPTTITAITMDFDIENNEATLLGDVVVDDQDIKIECNRMKIFLEDKKEESKKENQKADKKAPADANAKTAQADTKSADVKAEKAQDSASKTDNKSAVSSDKKAAVNGKADKKEDKSKSSDGGKQLVRIECVGDVIITRKPGEDEGQDQEQRATAGKAIYYFKDSIIELLDKPVVYADNKKITGRAITINLEQGGRMKLTLGKIEDYTETPLLDMGK